MITSETLLSVIDENSIGHNLTVGKTQSIINNPNNQTPYKISGFVVTDANGRVGIIDKAVVRWFDKHSFYDVMHPKIS